MVTGPRTSARSPVVSGPSGTTGPGTGWLADFFEFSSRRGPSSLVMKSTLAIVLKPIQWGWAVCLTDGRELTRFRGPGARWRALHYVRASFA